MRASPRAGNNAATSSRRDCSESSAISSKVGGCADVLKTPVNGSSTVAGGETVEASPCSATCECISRAACLGIWDDGGGVRSDEGGGGEKYSRSCLLVASTLPGVYWRNGVDGSLGRTGSGVGVLRTEMSDMLTWRVGWRVKGEGQVKVEVRQLRRKECRQSTLVVCRSRALVRLARFLSLASCLWPLASFELTAPVNDGDSQWKIMNGMMVETSRARRMMTVGTTVKFRGGRMKAEEFRGRGRGGWGSAIDCRWLACLASEPKLHVGTLPYRSAHCT